ncbi:hypothetical protein ACHAXR_005760 [Thalassiosira sp. AJA248-18]
MPTTNMMKEAIQALYPPRPTASRRRVRRSGSSSSYGGSFHENPLPQFRGPDATASTSIYAPSSSFGSSPSRRKAKSRFSELLLEHGEKDLHQDWAVCASSTLLSASSGNNGDNNSSCQMKQIEGRLRICSQSIVFEPRQPSRGIIRVPFRHMTVSPFIGGGNSNNSMDLNASGGGNLYGDAAFNNGTNSIGNSQQGMSAILRCERHVVLKANNVIGPFDYIQAPVEFKFLFSHSSPTSMISLSKRLFEMVASNQKSSVSFAPSVAFDTGAIIPLPSRDNNSRDAISEEILSPTMNRPFDTTNFLHVQEQPLTPNLQCSIKTPLLEQNGCAILTEYGFYFQSVVVSGIINNCAVNGIGPKSSKVAPGGKSHVWSLDDMRAIARRYDGMKDRGLEIYLAKQHSILLTFETAAVRERIIRILSQQISEIKSLPLPCFTDRSFVESALELWQAGELDNFEYLLCLNSAAGRSFHDLSRYPVFPWVLSRYGESNGGGFRDELLNAPMDFSDPNIFRDLSKPVGALSDERFEDFRKRYESMVQQQKGHASQHNQDAPFMYGTHYSAPGYVLFYLLRVMPEHMLCLQSGKFDVPDRLFHSIDATYRSILTNAADLKELIPEFYDDDCFDFLINSMGLQLGNLQTGQRVNDVILPPWAKSAKHYIRQNRAALESDYCTGRLPSWIDLIFGDKSRGSGAKDARNLFHPMSYIGPADLEAIRNPEDRVRAELQSTEFGIVPDQLFCREHPGKSENIGSWGGSDAPLLTRDRLRESYGVGDSTTFSAPAHMTPQQSRNGTGLSIDDTLAQHAGSNPFD